MLEGINSIYICGPMRGYPEDNYPAFNMAAGRMRNMGYPVVNPAETVGKLTFLGYMKIDLGHVCDVDALIALDGWQESEGALIEMFNAIYFGKKVYAYTGFGEISFSTINSAMQAYLEAHPEQVLSGRE